MKTSLKYIVIGLSSIVIAEIVTVVFFILRFATDSINFPATWTVVVPYLVPLFTSYIVYLFSKLVKLSKAKEFSIIILGLWLLWLVFLGKLYT